MTKVLKFKWLVLVLFLISCNKQENNAETAYSAPAKTDSIIKDTVVTPAKAMEDSSSIIEEIKQLDTTRHEENTEKEILEETSTPEAKQSEQARKAVAESVDTLETVEENIPRNFIPDHAAWDQLSSKYVTNDGKVNYSGLKSEKSVILDYINSLTENPPKPDWSHNVRLAYWINLYNAVTVNLVLDNYPLKSIMDINSGKAWDLKLVSVDGKELTLNDIEHNIIRKRFSEPRIHFAVNCAAKSCPKLLNGAFLPETLERQLENQANYFVHNTSKNHVSSEQLELSHIFDWYGSDFGDIKAFIKKYEPTANVALDINFLDYDWALNE